MKIKTLKMITMLYCYTKRNIIKAIKMNIVNSNATGNANSNATNCNM